MDFYMHFYQSYPRAGYVQMEDPRDIFRATQLQSIAKYLERIGDHATNVGELVVFMVKGKDIRHVGKLGDGG